VSTLFAARLIVHFMPPAIKARRKLSAIIEFNQLRQFPAFGANRVGAIDTGMGPLFPLHERER